jgi:hypothetical protein
VSKDDLSLEVRGDTIRISGRKQVEYRGMHRRERISGCVDRTVSLPVQPDPDCSKLSTKMAFSRSRFKGRERQTQTNRGQLIRPTLIG